MTMTVHHASMIKHIFSVSTESLAVTTLLKRSDTLTQAASDTPRSEHSLIGTRSGVGGNTKQNTIRVFTIASTDAHRNMFEIKNRETNSQSSGGAVRAAETAFTLGLHTRQRHPPPGVNRVRCGPTHAHKTCRSMREVSTESLAVTTLLTKRHANMGCERYPQARSLYIEVKPMNDETEGR